MFFLMNLCSAQQPLWTWISGENYKGSTPIYGIKGVPSAANQPSERHSSVSWYDKNGNLWLFGGNTEGGLLNDLWKYNPSTNEWTWMSGDSILSNFNNPISAHYGLKGVESVYNKPGARSESLSWIDEKGNLYLFGGWGYYSDIYPAVLNDLWKYDVITEKWTWLSGDSVGIRSGYQPGVYGTMGIPSINNSPASRTKAASWKDKDGNFWLYSGACFFGIMLTDLWKYNPSTNEWTWVKGDLPSSSIIKPVYGNKGIPSLDNSPGCLFNDSPTWTDNEGNLWLLGTDNPKTLGVSTISNGADAGLLDDLWKYNPSTNEWTWVKGDSLGYQHKEAIFGSQGVPDSKNTPGGKYAALSWTDSKTGKLWLYGGAGATGFAFNALWVFDPHTNEWTWIDGRYPERDYDPSYGEKGIAAITNWPGDRSHSIGWKDKDENIWLFSDVNNSNDLWKLTFCKTAPLNPTISASRPTAICLGDSVELTSSFADNYQWYRNNQLIVGATNQSYTATQAGDYTVRVSNTCSSVTSEKVAVTSVTISAPAITASGPTAFCEGKSVTLSSSIATGNQWFKNGEAISGAVNSTLLVEESGLYSVQVSAGGCRSTSKEIGIEVQSTTSAPIISSSGPLIFCEGGSVTLSSSKSSFNQWYRDNALINGASEQTYLVKESGTYTVRTENIGCSSLPSSAVVVLIRTKPEEPQITASGPTTLCEGNSVILNSSTSTNQWYRNSVMIPDGTKQSLEVTISGSYTVELSNGVCSSLSSPIEVDIVKSPSLIIESSSTINCIGAPVTFTAKVINAGIAPTFQWKKNGKDVGSNAPTYTDNSLITGDTITLQLIASTACNQPVISNKIGMTVNTDTPVPVNLGQDTVICDKPSYTINTNSGYVSYLWQNGSTDATLTVTQTGIYSVQVKDACGRTFTDTVQVKIEPRVDFSIGADLSICPGDTIMIKAPEGFINYQWTESSSLNSSGPTATVFPTDSTLYTVNAQTAAGCLVMDEVHVSLKQVKSINFGRDTTLCTGDSLLLNAGSGFTSYIWNTGSTLSSIIIKTVGTYSVRAQNQNGCYSYDTLSILKINPLPEVSLKGEPWICANATRILDAGPGYTSYNWNTGSITQQLPITSIGEYSVLVIDENGCKGSDTIAISQLISPPSGFLISDTAICQYGSITIESSQPFSTYLWSSGEQTREIEIKRRGVYRLQVTDQYGCTGTESVNVEEKQCLEGLFVPNAFTPNGDGKNDVFKPLIFGNIEQYRLTVYDRWGQLVFQSIEPSKGWNGKRSGHKVETGVYVWICNYQLAGEALRLQKGTVILIR